MPLRLLEKVRESYQDSRRTLLDSSGIFTTTGLKECYQHQIPTKGFPLTRQETSQTNISVVRVKKHKQSNRATSTCSKEHNVSDV